ncbi:uncharacterized protein [Amphiura filiformis]|uniref:uncharacterized protein n=1 Tax=Amphiura filiformis TaxID=82378 RepID=UPI003B20C7CC
MRKKKNRKRGQNCGELRSNMSVASGAVVDIPHEHSIGVGTEINLEHKEHTAAPKSKTKSKSRTHKHHTQDCRPKDPSVLKASLQKEPVLHNGCNCNDHHDVNSLDGSGTAIPHDQATLETTSSSQSSLDKNNQTIDSKCNSNKHKSVHQRLDAPLTSKNNSETNEPISELTKLVENIDIQNEFVSRGSALQQDIDHEAADLSGALIRDDDDDEMLEEFGAVGPSSVQLLENEDPSLEELPSSLSDFVLGYRNDSYPIPPVPPNDEDLDVIRIEGSELNIDLVPYESELQMPDIMRLITKDLSEPYSIYTYRYFIHNWPQLCFLAMHGSTCVGAIVCKLDVHKKMVRRGYIAMLAVDEKHRKCKIGSSLVRKAIRAMVRGDCDEVVLETEITNKPALRLYENLGFVRDKRIFRYYLNGVDALRLKLWLR